MISADQVHSFCHELTERRTHLLLPRRTDEIVRVLGQVSQRWLNPNDPWRCRAIAGMPKVTGFAPQMVARILDLLFSELTEEKLSGLVELELGAIKDKETGPPLIAQIFSGNIPNPAIVSIVCGLLVKSASFCKASTKDPLSSLLYLASLHDLDPDLASCVQIHTWKGSPGNASERPSVGTLERSLFQHADFLVAYGNDDSLRNIKDSLPAGKPFFGFGHKIGFAVVGQDALADAALHAAEDISLYDQQGCLSPHVVYVENTPKPFAEKLALAMEDFNRRIPRGTLSIEESAAIARVRNAYEFRAASDPQVAVWNSKGSDAWTVIYEEEPLFATGPLNRVVFVKPLGDLELSVARVRPYLHNVGLGCSDAHWSNWEMRLRKLGVARVCPLGQMQKPPLVFATGIRPRLRELIRPREA